ncbi:MAG: hypothetical protein QOJ59_3338, partial [Thermomicrobiales bacterium]|nr:hypothetical protein [Thermomicrobiales bacterium]
MQADAGKGLLPDAEPAKDLGQDSFVDRLAGDFTEGAEGGADVGGEEIEGVADASGNGGGTNVLQRAIEGGALTRGDQGRPCLAHRLATQQPPQGIFQRLYSDTGERREFDDGR